MIAKRARRGLVSFFAIFAAFAVVVVAVVLPSPARHVVLSGPTDPRVVKGALHIHTIRSDGGGTIDDVAAAAARAGLQFVIVTDHGDGRRLDPPAYRSGVLCIDGAEISTDDGHLVVAGFRTPEYRLAGEGRDVIEDIHRLGGLALVAHPASPKTELAWRDWDARFDGLEWLNGDAEWRDEAAPALFRLVVSYPFRPAAAAAAVFDRPVASLARFDEIAARRPLVTLAGHDAHARIAARGEDDYLSGLALPLPSYEAVFRSFAVRAVLDSPLRGDAAADAATVLRAIRHGRVYTAIDAIAAPERLAFVARSGSASVEIGGRLIPAGPIAFEVHADAPEQATIVLLHEGREVASGPPPRLEFEHSPVPGAYRVEVRVPGAPGQPPVPWILTNTIHVGIPSEIFPPVLPRVWEGVLLSRPADLPLWRVEHAPGSRGTFTPADGDGLVFTYQIGGGPSDSPYAALVRPLRVPADARAIGFRARADRPMRLSVQLRAAGGDGGVRWRRSVFLDAAEREIRIELSDMRPVDPGTASRPAGDRVDALLFVVDSVNTDPSASGQVWIGGVRVGG